MAPRKKATPAVDTEVKTEAAVETEKKTAAKKTTKAAAKSTARTTKAAAAKKTAAVEVKEAEPTEKAPADVPVVTAAPAAPKTEVFVEYGGAQVSVDEVISNARRIVGDDKDIKIYVQPDTSKAYIAFNGESVSMDVFFCK